MSDAINLEAVSLVACHLCGAVQGSAGPDVYAVKDLEGWAYRVECHGDDELCGLRTRFYESASVAASAWNRGGRPASGPLSELAEAGGYRPHIALDPSFDVAMFRIDGGRALSIDELLRELAIRRDRRRLIRDVRSAGGEETAAAMEGVLGILEQ